MTSPAAASAGLDALFSVLKTLKDADQHMTVQRALFFLYIARKGDQGCYQSEAGDAIDVSVAARSKHAQILGDRGGPQGEAPLGWIEIIPQASRDGGNVLRLSRKGKAVVEQMRATLGGR